MCGALNMAVANVFIAWAIWHGLWSIMAWIKVYYHGMEYGLLWHGAWYIMVYCDGFGVLESAGEVEIIGVND